MFIHFFVDLLFFYFFFFFKQKTAYEMRISDWSSDVCSSDLFDRIVPVPCCPHSFQLSRSIWTLTVGTPRVAARCLGPESLPTIILALERTASNSSISRISKILTRGLSESAEPGLASAPAKRTIS